MKPWRCMLGRHIFEWEPHWQMPPGSAVYFRLTMAAECARPGCEARAVMDCDPDTHWRDKHPDGQP